MKSISVKSNDIESLCPLCNSKEKTILVDYKSADSLKHLSILPSSEHFKPLKDQIIEMWGGDKCNFVECSNCNFNYAVPFIGGSNELYSCLYNDPAKDGLLKWEHITARSLIIDKFGLSNLPNTNLLEFGPGDGAFLKDIAKNGLKFSNVICIESSESCIAALNNFGIKCLPSDLSVLNSDEFKNKFDIIAMFQVLEHLEKIDETFKIINNITTTNASIFIAVPNNVIRRLYEKNGIFLDIPPIHVSRWNEQSFKRIGEKYGWKVKYYEIEKVTFFKSAYLFVWNKSLKDSIGKIKKRFIRKSLIGIVILPLLLINVFKILKIKSNSNGTSQLVHLEKINQND